MPTELRTGGAVIVQGIESAGPGHRLDGSAVDDPTVDPTAEVEQVDERTILLPGRQNSDDRRLAGALDRAQAIADRVRSTGKNLNSDWFTSGGSTAISLRMASSMKMRHHIRVVHIGGQRGGHEGRRVMGL